MRGSVWVTSSNCLVTSLRTFHVWSKKLFLR